MGQNGTAPGSVDQTDRCINREKPFRFIAGHQVAFKGGVHALHMPSGKQGMADMRTADRAAGAFPDIGGIKRLSPFICQLPVDLFDNPLTSSGAKVTEFRQGILKRLVFMIERIAQQMQVLVLLPDHRQLHCRDNLDAEFSARSHGLRNAVDIIVIRQGNCPQTKAGCFSNQLSRRQNPVGEGAVEVKVNKIGHSGTSYDGGG